MISFWSVLKEKSEPTGLKSASIKRTAFIWSIYVRLFISCVKIRMDFI